MIIHISHVREMLAPHFLQIECLFSYIVDRVNSIAHVEAVGYADVELNFNCGLRMWKSKWRNFRSPCKKNSKLFPMILFLYIHSKKDNSSSVKHDNYSFSTE